MTEIKAENKAQAFQALNALDRLKGRFILTPELMRLHELVGYLGDVLDPDAPDDSAVEWLGELESLVADLIVSDDEIEMLAKLANQQQALPLDDMREAGL